MPTQPPPSSVLVRVPAKLNLHLGVGAARADGYHELVTVFHAIDLDDELSVHPGGSGLRLAVRGAGAEQVPGGPGNLAWQAAALIAEHAGVPADVLIEIDKRIPVSGGMAGGSADAAATLLACARLWLPDATAAELAGLAARLGSDTVFPLTGGTALAGGRGEQVRAVQADARLCWVIAFASFGISAGAAYAELDRLRAEGRAPVPLGAPDALLAALRAGDVQAVAAGLGNDLQAAALSLRPALAATLEAGTRLGALAGIVSGSGPTCAFLCADDAAARELAAGLAAFGTCRDAVVAHGPAYPQLSTP